MICPNSDLLLFYPLQYFTESRQKLIQYLMQQIYQGRYERIERIGNGAYGVIYKGRLLIAKHIALQKLERSKALQEFKILQKLRHHYIVRYEDSFTAEDELILVMEYCGERDLKWHIEQRKKNNKHFSEYLVINWILQLLLAIGFMHTNKILHRDIKPQNVFVDSDMNLKVGDFGISKLLDSTAQNCQTSAGTPSYMAPEMVDSQDYSFKADIWSLGCVIYEICALERVFPIKDAQDKPIGLLKMMDMIKHKEIKEIPSLYSQDLRKLVKKMLTRIPEKRPRAQELLKDKLLVQLMINRINEKDSLKHEYPKGHDVPSLTSSLLDRQAELVKQQLRHLQVQVGEKMEGLKQKKVEKTVLQSYQQQLKKKMQEVQMAVKKAFQQLYTQGKFQQEIAEDIPAKQKGDNKSTIQSSSLQNSSDVTIQSVQLQSNKQINNSNRKSVKNQSNIDLVQSAMIQSKLKATPNKIKIQSSTSALKQSPSAIKQSTSAMKQSSQSQSQSQKQKLEEFQKTVQSQLAQSLQSQFEQTLQSEYTNTFKDPQILTNTLNKLDILKSTLQKNPEAILSNSFLSCTLSVSSDPLRPEKALDLAASDSLSFQLTKRSSPGGKTEKQLGFQKNKEKGSPSKQEKSEAGQYEQDFEEYNEEINERRQQQLQSMLYLYQQELTRQQSQNAMSQGFKYRNKYLMMSEIKEQSNEGSSVISRNQQLD